MVVGFGARVNVVDVAALENSEHSTVDQDARKSRSYGLDSNERARVSSEIRPVYSGPIRAGQNNTRAEKQVASDNEKLLEARNNDEKEIIVGYNVENAPDAA